MNKLNVLLFCFMVSLAAVAQKPVINFASKDFDFGKIKEADGDVTHVFEFINKGKAPLVVNRVNASCGCTTPTWTKEPIEYNKKGAITVTYSTAGRPGSFYKTITVFSNDSINQVLVIKGEVIPKH